MKKMLINGEWCDAQDGRTIPVIDPSTGLSFDDVARGTKPEIDAAVRVAALRTKVRGKK